MTSPASSSSASSSFASTSSRSSRSIADTCTTAPPRSLDPPRRDERRRDEVHLPSLKATLIHLPLDLPLPPEPLPAPSERLVLDDDLEGSPIGFVIHRLKKLGPEMLRLTTETVLYSPSGPQLPQYLRCALPARLRASASPSCMRPSHILGIRSTDSTRTLLVPVHGLLFAAHCPPLEILSSAPEKQPAHPSLPTVPRPRSSSSCEGEGQEVELPIIEVNVPSSSAFPLLQGWIYLRSSSLLLSSLLPAGATDSVPPPPPRRPTRPAPSSSSSSSSSSLSHLLNPQDEPTSSFEEKEEERNDVDSVSRRPPSSEALTHALANVPSSLLLKHVHLVHGLWGNVVCLGVSPESDAPLWNTMAFAWKILVAALALKERNRKAKSS